MFALRPLPFSCFSLAVVAALLMRALAAAAPPKLSYLFPAGGQRGAKTEVRCLGDFSWPIKVWAPGVNVEVQKKKGELTISVPADLHADRVWLRLHNEEGVSTSVPFLIGSLPETREQEPNDSPNAAQELADVAPPPGDSQRTINGILEKNGDVDGFAVTLAAGQTLIASVDANTAFDSPMDSILQLCLPDGTLLAENHDSVGLDPRLAYTAQEMGTYIVRIFAFPAQPNQRIEFHGGSQYIYRLTLTTGPFISHCVPMAVQRLDDGSFEPDTVEVRGWNVPDGARLPVRQLASSDDWTEHCEMQGGLKYGLIRAHGWAGSARVHLLPWPCSATDPSATETKPAPLAIPSAAFGSIVRHNQKDHFQLSLRKGEPVELALDALSIRSSLVPFLRLLDHDGKVAAETSERGPIKDVTLQHTPKSDGNYRLEVSDRFQQSGPQHFYRLIARPRHTDFELTVDSESLTLSPDKPLDVTVNVTRTASKPTALGEISIEAVDLPAGVTSTTVISKPEGDSSGKVTLQLTTTGEAASSSLIRIRGVSAETEATRHAFAPARFGTRFERIWLTNTASDSPKTPAD